MADVSSVKENVKRAFYVRTLNHPNYLEIIATRPEIRLDKLERNSPDALVSSPTKRANRVRSFSLTPTTPTIRPR